MGITGDNSLLLALTLVERAESQIKSDKRDQMNRVELEMVKELVSQALGKVNPKYKGVIGIYTQGNLIGVVEVINGLLENENYVETDTETKELLENKLNSALAQMYIEVGKYYSDHEFEYSPRMTGILSRVVDACVAGGYYFGEEKNIVGGE